LEDAGMIVQVGEGGFTPSPSPGAAAATTALLARTAAFLACRQVSQRFGRCGQGGFLSLYSSCCSTVKMILSGLPEPSAFAVQQVPEM
jgi:hypothetical protein